MSSTCLRNQRFRKHDSKFEELVTMLSAKGTIHCLQYLYLFVYQVLRTFNMLTKSKISEARCSDVENIVTMLSNEVAIHSWFQVRRTCNHVECQRHDTLLAILYLFVFPNFEEICKHVEHRRCDTYLFYQIMMLGETHTAINTRKEVTSCFTMPTKLKKFSKPIR